MKKRAHPGALILLEWPILSMACVPEYAVVDLHGVLDIEDAANRTMAVEFIGNSRLAGHCDIVVMDGEIVEARLYQTGDTLADFRIGPIRQDYFEDASYTVGIFEAGQRVSLPLIPRLCREKSGPFDYNEVVTARLSIPRCLAESKVIYPREQKETTH